MSRRKNPDCAATLRRNAPSDETQRVEASWEQGAASEDGCGSRPPCSLPGAGSLLSCCRIYWLPTGSFDPCICRTLCRKAVRFLHLCKARAGAPPPTRLPSHAMYFQGIQTPSHPCLTAPAHLARNSRVEPANAQGGHEEAAGVVKNGANVIGVPVAGWQVVL
ncbi:hypothetical protein NDU88_000348 [Pleurodeles waltl]|uniref:Uncharacterized protein n=1 Tax=Pleurodeles waltl TaxID=8319 RepID=A0AAV7U400_PLEWA|nr:hypothetical protein NDU88_000348 [Pleurodeles waltl]